MGICKCPFCHEPLEFQHVAWVACAGCLARHHQSCWTESPRCAACGDPRALTLPPPRPKARGRLVRLAAGAGRLAASALVVLGPAAASTVWLTMRLDQRVDREPVSSVAEQEALKVATKRIEKAAARAEKERESEDRTDEVLQALETSESKMKKRIESVAADVAQLRRIAPTFPQPAAPSSVAGMATAIEQLETLKKDGVLTSSQRDATKRGVLAGKVPPENVVEVVRLAKLKESGLLSASELERAKQGLLDK